MSGPVKVLYAAFRHDPRDPSSSSGSLFFCYQSLIEAGFDVKICGPFPEPAHFLERLFRNGYTRWTGMRYIKYHLSVVWRMSRALRAMDRDWRPDVVFSIYPPCLAAYQGSAPCVFDQDTSFIDFQRNYGGYGRLAFRTCVAMERKAFSKCARVITHSDHARKSLVTDYGVKPECIDMFPYPPVLPGGVLDRTFKDPLDPLEAPLRLLLVGVDYRRKGADIAIEVVRLLNERGVEAELTLCGLEGVKAPYVNCVGRLKKTDPEQLERYLDLYRRTHLLVHPTRFDPSPLVPSEAAAFGVPTITNNAGGMATTVADGVSGIVLPKDSPPESYVDEIIKLARDPARYRSLRISTRQRYETELNWEVTSKRLAVIVAHVAEPRQELDGVRDHSTNSFIPATEGAGKPVSRGASAGAVGP
jgi:glycosyltransferase involved in cell wall biosynthesis